MKSAQLLLPVAALVLVTAWVGIQWREFTTLEVENKRLGRQIFPAVRPSFTEELFPELVQARAK